MAWAGAVIGKLEDVLVVALVAVDQYTALALVFGLKEVVRVQRDRDHASYYILGTLANVTWAIGVALGTKWLVEHLA